MGSDGGAYLWTEIRQSPMPERQGELSMSEILTLSTEEQHRYVCGKALEAAASFFYLQENYAALCYHFTAH